MTKIKTLTIVNQQGTNLYQVGGKYNDLIIEKIIDLTATGEPSHVPRYQGLTKNGEIVFEAINCPTDIAYGK